MNARWLLNLGLLASVVVLGVFIYLEPGDDEAPPAGTPLLACDPAAIDRLQIERAEGEPVTLSRTGTGWRLTAPFDARANGYRVQSILNLCRARSLSQYPAATLDLKSLALDPPRARLQLGDQTLLFGGTEALDQRRYVQLGETVHLLEEDVYRHLLADPAGFVDLALLPEGNHLQALQLPGLGLTRGDQGWQVTGATPESQDAAQALVDGWEQARALRVSRAAAPVKGSGEVVLTLAGREAPLHFALEQDATELRLTRNDLGLTYHLPAATGADLLKLTTP